MRRNRLLRPTVVVVLFFILTGAVLAQRSRTGAPPRQPAAQQRPSTASVDNLTIKTKTTSSGQTSETTLYYKGRRQRTLMDNEGMKGAVITQCDLKRSLMISDTKHKYLIQPFGQNSSTQQPTQTRRGAVVLQTITNTDTGERKQMFGYTARHLKSVMITEYPSDSCDGQRKERMETDGWYIDLELPECAGEMYKGYRSECEDEIRTKQTGPQINGYPVLYTATYFNEDGSVKNSMTIEVTELSKAPLDAALFDVPAGYDEARNAMELYDMNAGGRTSPSNASDGRNSARGTDEGSASSSAGAKRPGSVRVGVVMINNKTDRSVSTASLRDQLISSLSDSKLDAVALDASSPSVIETEAKQKQCDFILYTDISSLKQASASKKIGGLLGRAAGVGSGGVDKSEARVDYRLIPVGGSSPQVQSSATAKEEGDEASVGTALQQEAQTIRSKIGR